MTQLHEMVTALAAPWVVLSPRSGQLTGSGVEGVYARDRRILSRLTVTVDGQEPTPLQADERSASSHEYVAVVPGGLLYRRRDVHRDGLTERITLVNNSRDAREYRLEVAVGTDLASIVEVRNGTAEALPELDSWERSGTSVTVDVDPGLVSTPRLEPGERHTVTVTVAMDFAESVSGFDINPPVNTFLYTASVHCSDHRVERWFEQSLADVQALQLAVGTDRYLGAGPPWYLTLFGRDSLISAGMLIPVDPELAAGTLRILAQWQGTAVDSDTAEQPGKIPHELRAEAAEHGADFVLPPVYYGTHDATQLWIMTLHKAWRWGMPSDQVRDLLPNLKRALEWLRDYADPDGDGFLEYIDESGHGLANQGWKDSDDSVQWPNGDIAIAPIALCEVQGYAYAAAVQGAELLEAYGESGDEWRAWAAALQERFRAAFWVDGYPAIALDGQKNAVRGRASNMGHLLGTGLLDADEEQRVAEVLAAPDLNSGFGLRTLSTTMSRFNPIGYHTGSIWPHDTAMTIQGLYATGHHAIASTYVEGLLRAAESFTYRLPELYAGRGATEETHPSPYPGSCRPQAWAAASAIAVLVAALGIHPDTPGNTLLLTPPPALPWPTLTLNLTLAAHPLTLNWTSGKTTVLEAPNHLQHRIT
ncbi:amylo-alpha-16-glucosidase [Kribbella sandramycini]|uniref:Amylo-alpha-16-glucosidase n=1 Tax=Kribbella sandramycini TaxID=60450 RepID=A0A7Y4KY30_9ACTN|nr:glycogen debranching N-terminal domain-containing protein [Kribbella sandramycini]MBB6569370.1 glycogen debranching enzyme [Kribbella sandramycini]NOL40792.1 amylo-alpha-16-glucosidase [Kribbella sandramycini]